MEKYGVLTDTWFKEIRMSHLHIDSFNDFVDHKLQTIVDSEKGVEPNIEGYRIKFGKITLGEPSSLEADGSRPAMCPMEARLRSMTYSAPLYLEMSSVEHERVRETYRIYIGELPIMVKSKYCRLNGLSNEELIKSGEDPLDPGGYFIVNGTERLITAAEEISPNRLLIDIEGKSGNVVSGFVLSKKGAAYTGRITITKNKEGILFVNFPTCLEPLPLVAVIRALGVESDLEIMEMFPQDKEILDYVLLNLESCEPKNVEDAWVEVGKSVAPGQIRKYKLRRIEAALDRYILPHVGIVPESRKLKAEYLAFMASRIIDASLGRIGSDDKDHYANKRVWLDGYMFELLFRQAFVAMSHDIKYQLEKAVKRGRPPAIMTAIRPDALTLKIKTAIATGTWPTGKRGVTELVDRTSYVATLSSLRRIKSVLSHTHAQADARDLHPTHWGKLCPIESPEGRSAGLTKGLALGAKLTVNGDEEMVKKALQSLGAV